MSPRQRKRNGFAQKSPPFLTYLKNILRKYPDGGQILKELIQNADDAGASEVIFIHDERNYGTESLWSDDLLDFQGPALLAYNNATFSDDDWKGLQSTGQSLKFKDPNTVGRFGLGFNSVYHMTDLPGVFSGRHIGLLDPQRTAFDDGGFMWTLDDEEDRKEVESLSDQFLPFCDVLRAIERSDWNTIKESGHFKGTLFRFPLRSSSSEISDNLYSTERVKELFECFATDVIIGLLFLRNVTNVSLKTIGPDGVVKHLLTAVATLQDDVTLDNINSASSELLTKIHVRETSLKVPGRLDEVCKWLVMASTVKDGSCQDLDDLAKKLHNIPTIALAYSLTDMDNRLHDGRLSCFLPLPDREENRTGLPVLINASFDLTDDRRSIKWVEMDQQHDESALWNHLLVEKILPLVYCQAVSVAVSFVRSSDSPAILAYGIWPDPSQTQHKGRWHGLTEKISQNLWNIEVLCMAVDSTQWIKPCEAVFVSTLQDTNIQHALENLLLCAGEPLVKVPVNILKTLQLTSNKHTGLKIVTPNFTREVLRSGLWHNLNSEQKLLIMEYVISDGQYRDLLGLELLPLSDGTFIRFMDSDHNGTAFIDSIRYPRLLLPGLAGRFILSELKPEVYQHLWKIGENYIFRNLVCLDKEVIQRNLLKALPANFISGPEKVTWHPGEWSQPPKEWLQEFWKFLQQDLHALSPFEGYPLVPLASIYDGPPKLNLARLRQKSSLLFLNKDEHILAENTAKMLETVGCTVIRHWDSHLWHENLSQFIMTPTSNNILKAFSNIGLGTVLGKLMEMTIEQKKLLCDLLSQAGKFSTDECKILSQLPIFCKLGSLQCSGSRLVPANDARALDKVTVPPIPRDLVLPETILICRDEKDHRLLLQMRVEFLSAADVAAVSAVAIRNGQYVHQQEQAERIMLWILKNGDVLFSQNNELRKTCENLSFVPCNGKLVSPSALFDPHVETFRELFELQRFPPKDFQEPHILKSLRTLGLKASLENITAGDVLQVAEEVSKRQASVELQVLERKARSLIRVCNDTPVLSRCDSSNIQTLRSMAWVPHNTSNSKTTFLKPLELRRKKISPLVEYSMPLTDEFNEVASSILGLNDLPPAEKIIENLAVLSHQYPNIDFYTLVMKLHTIYKYVQDSLTQFKNGLHLIKIWNGDGFSDPPGILLSYPEGLDLSCQIKKVPQDFLLYRKLFLNCGVQETLSDGKVICFLHEMMDMQERNYGCGTSKELKLVISVLNWMKIRGLHSTDDLPVPVQSCKGLFTLKPLSTALFCDMPKEHLKDLGENLEHNIVHEDISYTTAAFLKLPLLSTNILKPEYFEPWGPSEPITLRIKNILREYSEEVDLFKEMIQNAEDAGATVCSFLVDMRQNLQFRNSLLDPAMASCHGPALWSYNNSKFSNEDFRNITRVGAATKELQVEKIGKFGLGFNTVYHITDVPSIVSGGSVLIFDPNVNHLRKHIKSEANPGIKLNFRQHPHVLQLFADQFHPYQNIFGCDIKESLNYDGTLIRLPFRTEEEAKYSKICTQSFNDQQIQLFLNIVQKLSKNVLVFLKGMQEVSLSILYPDSLPPNKHTLKFKLFREQVHKWNIPEGFLFQSKQMTVASALAGKNVLHVKESTIIKVSVSESSATHTQLYLLHSSYGIGESFEMFQNNKQKKTVFSLPVAAIALPLTKNVHTGKWRPNLEGFNGQVFCFLPLPIFSGLPFHLNATFAAMSNRKSLWNTTEKGEWNRKLICDAVLVTWARALALMQKMHQDGSLENYNYHTFWPDLRWAQSLFVEALKAFYRAVATGLNDAFLEVFSNGQKWCTIAHACFLISDIVDNKEVGKVASEVFSKLLPPACVAVPMPEWVKSGFQASGCGEILLQNTYNWERFYKDIVFNNLHCLEANERDILISHAIDMNNKEVDKLLKSISCIPSTPSGTLQLISNLVHPQGKVAPLFEKEEGHFLYGTVKTYLRPDRLSRLELLGILKDSIPMKLLMERARTIAEVWRYDRAKAFSRICHVLELLKDLMVQNLSNTDQVTFRNIAFLPAILPPSSNVQEYPEITIKKPTEIFHYKHLSLVGFIEPVLSKGHIGQNFKFTSDIIEFLGLTSCPSVQTVMLQLEHAHKKSRFLTSEELAYTVRKCYTYLNKVLQDRPNVGNEIRMKAATFPFVLMGQKCVPSSSVAHKLSFEADPYLYQLPKEYQQFHTLWHCVGLRDTFAIEDYMTNLKNIAGKHPGKPLSKYELDLALNLIKSVSEGSTDDPAFSLYQAHAMFLPDKQGILRSTDKLHYNDTPWLPCDNDTLLCHEMIPRYVALKFNVPTKIHKTLKNLKICELSRWVSEFGAKEDLTRRIKNIINEYSSRKDVLKELIQNADDSGASELHFVLDARTHPAVRTFGKEWTPLQGPALCIYNNRLFTNEDIDGIQQLGKGGKRDKLDTTGKYGLGFNAVYHLTDCPSFVTGDSMLCIFDPNLLFLKTSAHNSPGAKMAVNHEFKMTFQDVYDTFLPDKFDLEHGTIFRLPLRTAETVVKSHISNQTVSIQHIRELCEELKRDANNLILFLNNIQTITFSHISDEDGALKKILSIETKMNSMSKTNHVAFRKKLHEFAAAEALMNKAQSYQVFFTVEVKCSWDSLSSKWVLAKQIGVEGEDKLSDIRSVCESLKCPCLPHGAVAACMNHFIPGRAFCTLPLPVGTGLPVHINGNFIVDSARRDICQEDGGSPKTEWNSLLLTHLLAPLYCDLLEHLRISLIQSSTGQLKFENFKPCESFFNSKLLNFFPNIAHNVPRMWQKLVGQVYRSIYEKQSPLIPVYKKTTIQRHTFKKDIVAVEWSSVSQRTVTEQPHFLMHMLNEEMEQVLQNINVRLVLPIDSLKKIFMEFNKAEVCVQSLSPETVCAYLRVQTLHTIGHNLPLLVSDTLIQNEGCCRALLNYCLKVERSKYDDLLNGLPLLVTLDGKLRRLCKTETTYHTIFSALFPAYKHRFTSNTTVQDETAALLEEAGFLKDFSIEESADYIKEHLGQRFCMSGKEASTELELAKSEEAWLKEVWIFFQSKISKNNTADETSCKIFQLMVSLFSDWAILPVCFEHKKGTFVFPLRCLNEVVYEFLDDMVKCLSKLGFAKLNTSFMPFEISYHWIKPQLLQTMDYTSVLHILHARTAVLPWKKLLCLEKKTLLRNLVSALSNTKNKSAFIYMLQYLPLFETIQGSRQSLNVYKKRYILQTKLSKEQNIFQDLYRIDSQTVFLRDCKLYKQLAVDLNIDVFNDLEFLVHFLLPLLPSMLEKQVLQVLKLVQNITNLYYDEFEPQSQLIFTSLGSLKFIQDDQGILQRPCYFYDCDSSLFIMFKPHYRFIPEVFFKQLGCSFSSIKTLLLGIGMRHEVSDDDFIEFATAIEKDAKGGISVELLKPKINLLLSHMLQLNVDNLTKDFIKRVSIIKFLANACITWDLQNIHPPYISGALLVPLKGSIAGLYDDDEMLVWTSKSIIQTPHALTHNDVQLLKSFGVLFHPPVESVLQNLENVCKAVCKSKEMLQTLFQVLEKNYRFLQSHLPFDSNPLTGVPVILVEDNVLAAPSEVLISLQEDHVFRPYLFRMHPQFVCFQLLFQTFGVEVQPTVFHYGRVLSRIYAETKEKEAPHGNQKKTVLKATENLVLLLKEGKSIKDLQLLKPLYLPASDGRLYDSSTLVFNNCASTREPCCLESAFKFLLHIENCSLFNDPYELEKLLNQLPEDIRPKMFSQVTTETIHSMPLCSLGDSCELKGQLYDLLLSSSFQEALASLLRCQNKGTVSAEDATKQCKAVFRKLEIICCEKIQTILLKGSKTIQGSCQTKDVFIHKGSDGQCQVCIMHKNSMSVQETVSIMTSLAKEINVIMLNVLSRESTLILLEILTCKCSQEMSNVMKKHGILTRLTASKAAFSLPHPGEEIPEEWHDSLDMSILNSFKVGDYVGFMDPSRDNIYLYAVIQEQLESRVCGGSELEMFLIDLGPGHIIPVCALDIYQFKIISQNNCSEQAMVKNVEEHKKKPNDWFKKSLGDIKKEIDEQLCEIWKLSKKERTQAIRRLYLQYHPDKNSGQDRLANEICKYLQQKIRDLEEDKKFTSPCYSNKPDSSCSGYSNNWTRWDGEASRHRQRHEDFTRRSNCEYDFWGYHDRQQRKPRAEEANRWFQQAECDLRAASNDVDRDSPEWVLYKVHQAVKKALIAALCKKPGIFETDVPISDLASKVSTFASDLEDVPQKVSELERLGVDNMKTQYPNCHPAPRIPNDSYPSMQDEAVLQLARDVLDIINAYVQT